MFAENPRRLAVADGVLYATLEDSVVSMRLGADGSMPAKPTGSSLTISGYNPVDVKVRNGILYVAASGIGVVESFQLEDDGDIPSEPTGSGIGEFPSDFSILEFNGDFLYTGSRNTEYIDVFILEQDGHVPDEAEQQEPRDSVALPDAIEIRDDVLYVTSARDRSIRAYRLLENGFVPPEEDSRTEHEEYYSDILLAGDFFYASAYNAGRIDLYELKDDGMIREEPPFFKTKDDPASYPSAMLEKDGILYVTQAGLDRVDAYVLDPSGTPPKYPTSSTEPAPGRSYPLGMVLYELD
jgi:6-phosphogluconolactonase (cycloisomerase 2 family)